MKTKTGISRVFLFILLAVGCLNLTLPSTSAAQINLDEIDYSSREQLGPYDAIVLEYVKGAPYVVSLHGYGGIGITQFEALKSEIAASEVLKKVNWIFPTYNFLNIESRDPEVWRYTATDARRALSKMLAAAKIDPRDVIWAGYSMGAVTAIDYVLHSKIPPKGLIANSGLYLDIGWEQKNSNLAGVKFLISHDRKGDMYPFSQAKKIEGILKDHGMIGRTVSHSQGHNIPVGFTEKAIREILQIKTSPSKRRSPRGKVSKSCGSLFT